MIHFTDDKGNFSPRPFIYSTKKEVDKDTLERRYVPDTSKKFYLQFLAKGEPYKLLGFLPARHPPVRRRRAGPLFLFGTDRLGRDMFSRMIYGVADLAVHRPGGHRLLASSWAA